MRKRYTAAFKAQMVHELLKEEKTVSQLATEHGVHPTQLGQWKKTALAGLPSLFDDHTAETIAALTAEHTQQTEQLYAEIGRLTTQLAWVKKKSGLTPEPR